MANNLSMFKGDTSLVITVPSSVLGSTGLSLYTSIWFTAKLDWSNLDADPDSIQKTLAAANLAVTTAGSNTVNGVLTATLLDADTSSLPDNAISLVYDVRGKTAGGAEVTLVSGFLLVQPMATKAR